MQTHQAWTLGILLSLGAAASGLAAPPIAARSDENLTLTAPKGTTPPAVDDFGDPDDFGAALLAGADYLVGMQADFTEDNAGNGFSDSDPDDAGWDWNAYMPTLNHSAAASPPNTMGETAMGLVKAWQLSHQASYMTALDDVANRMIAVGPTGTGGYHHSADVIFLLEFAGIATSPTPAACRNAARNIWIYQLATYGPTATLFAEDLRDTRAVDQGYHNGVVPWDLGAWAQAVAQLDLAFPGQGYGTDADDIAEVMWQDSFNANPGYFQPYNPVNQGFDPTWGDTHFWWYTLGITGLIDGFTATGTHTAELAGLQATLLACQYPGGAFSGSYGANPTDEDWQTTGYAMSTMGASLSGLQSELNDAATWLATTQDVSGAFVYGDGSHYPSVVGQCVAGLSYSDIYRVNQDPLYRHVAVNEGPSYTNRVMTNYSLTAGMEAYRALTVFVDYDPAVLTPVAIDQEYFPGDETFQSNLAYNPNGHLEITLAILGPTPGISGAVGSLFTITWNGILEDVNPGTAVHIAQVVMRDPLNQDIFAASGADVEIEVDDTDPTLVVTPPAEPCLNDDFEVTLDADDNVNLERIEYQFDGAGPWLPAVTGMTVDSFFDVFSVDISGLTPGDHTIVFMVWDDVGYSFDADGWPFHKDFLAPTAASNLAAMPDDHLVSLTWTAGSNLDGYEVWRAKRGTDYPYVGGRPPLSTWPGDYTHIDDLGPTAVDYDDDFGADTYVDRGIYDYVLVSVDCVNDPSASAAASATNYFLGDWADADGYGDPDNYDGFVCTPDLTWLATVYGTLAVPASHEMDVAPTHDMSRFGLPGPDTHVNFEDLIVLAMNYRGGCTTPLLQIRRGDGAGQLADAATRALLTGAGAERQLVLDGTMLGLTVDLATTAELLSVSTTHGTALSYRTATGWTVDVVGLTDLLSRDTVISLRFTEGAEVSLTRAEGRDEANGALLLEGVTEVLPAQPAVFALAQNQPNPFNPTTVIHYSLADDATVRLSVFNSMGQLVRVLQDGPQTAGAHEATLDGSRLASGLYVYRLEAGAFTAQQKMILVK